MIVRQVQPSNGKEAFLLALFTTLEDALGVAERPNRPGTTTEWPNWSLALPVPLEELKTDPRPARLAEAMRR